LLKHLKYLNKASELCSGDSSGRTFSKASTAADPADLQRGRCNPARPNRPICRQGSFFIPKPIPSMLAKLFTDFGGF
jgi:hypothetical protein